MLCALKPLNGPISFILLLRFFNNRHLACTALSIAIPKNVYSFLEILVWLVVQIPK